MDKSSHNTPPPFLIAAGSLIVERKDGYLPADIKMNAAGRKEHHINPASGKIQIFPAHIKVVDGSGEILYRNDRAKSCAITLQVREDPGPRMMPVTVSASAVDPMTGKQTFIIETDGTKILDNTNQTPSTKRDVRYKLKDGSKTFTLEEIRIVDGTKVLYQESLPSLPAFGDELKIMIWLEQS